MSSHCPPQGLFPQASGEREEWAAWIRPPAPSCRHGQASWLLLCDLWGLLTQHEASLAPEPTLGHGSLLRTKALCVLPILQDKDVP